MLMVPLKNLRTRCEYSPFSNHGDHWHCQIVLREPVLGLQIAAVRGVYSEPESPVEKDLAQGIESFFWLLACDPDVDLNDDSISIDDDQGVPIILLPFLLPALNAGLGSSGCDVRSGVCLVSRPGFSTGCCCCWSGCGPSRELPTERRFC